MLGLKFLSVGNHKLSFLILLTLAELNYSIISYVILNGHHEQDSLHTYYCKEPCENTVVFFLGKLCKEPSRDSWPLG